MNAILQVEMRAPRTIGVSYSSHTYAQKINSGRDGTRPARPDERIY